LCGQIAGKLDHQDRRISDLLESAAYDAGAAFEMDMRWTRDATEDCTPSGSPFPKRRRRNETFISESRSFKRKADALEETALVSRPLSSSPFEFSLPISNVIATPGEEETVHNRESNLLAPANKSDTKFSINSSGFFEDGIVTRAKRRRGDGELVAPVDLLTRRLYVDGQTNIFD